MKHEPLRRGLVSGWRYVSGPSNEQTGRFTHVLYSIGRAHPECKGSECQGLEREVPGTAKFSKIVRLSTRGRSGTREMPKCRDVPLEGFTDERFPLLFLRQR